MGGKADIGVCDEKAMPAQVRRSSRSLRLHLPTLCFPITPSQVVVSRLTFTLKLPKNDELVGVGDGVDVIVEFLIELVLVTLG